MDPAHEGGACIDEEFSSEFLNLPEEQQYDLMNHMTAYELFCFAAPIFKRWQKIHYEPSLSHHLTVKCHISTLDQSRDTMEEYSQVLQSLVLKHLINYEDVVDTLLDCTQLCSLTMYKCGELDVQLLKSLTRNLPHIQEVSFEGSLILDQAAREISRWKGLKSVNLSHCPLFLDTTVISVVHSCKHLEYINIDRVGGLSDRSIRHIARKSKSLRALFIDGLSLVNDAYFFIGSKCKNLTALSIAFGLFMKDVTLLPLKMLTNLTYFRINNANKITAVGFITLFEGSNWKELTYLNLGYCGKVNDSVIYQLSKSSPKLEKLVLSCCCLITDLGVNIIFDSFKCVRFLFLKGLSEITEAPFISIPRNFLTHLLTLDLTGCFKIDVNCILDLLIVNPWLTIWDIEGNEISLGIDELLHDFDCEQLKFVHYCNIMSQIVYDYV